MIAFVIDAMRNIESTAIGRLLGYVRDTERAAIKNVLAIGDERHDPGYVAALDGGAQRSVDRGDRRLRVRVREEYDAETATANLTAVVVRFMDPPSAGCECLPRR